MLTTLAQVQAIPGMASQPPAWLSQNIAAASQTIKSFCNLYLESQTLTQFYNGKGLPNLILLQWPVTAVTAVYVDQTGYGGQAPNAFPASTQWLQGQNFYLDTDTNATTSLKALLVAIAGNGVWSGDNWFGWGSYTPYGNKLAATRKPYWPVGNKNIKVVYVAGFTTVPSDLAFAASSLVAAMVRNQPMGGPLQSESLGSYSYSMLSRAVSGQLTDLTDYGSILRKYREIPF